MHRTMQCTAKMHHPKALSYYNAMQ